MLLSQVAPLGPALLGPYDHRLVTTVEIRLRPLLLSPGQTYFVFTVDPVCVFMEEACPLVIYSMVQAFGSAMSATSVP